MFINRSSVNNPREIQSSGMLSEKSVASRPFGYNSSMRAHSGTSRYGLSVRMMLMGTIVALAQLENSYMLNGAHDGNRISSGGRLGVPLQSHCPNKASQIFVKTRVFGTPPLLRMNSRARVKSGESAGCPASLRAK